MAAQSEGHIGLSQPKRTTVPAHGGTGGERPQTHEFGLRPLLSFMGQANSRANRRARNVLRTVGNIKVSSSPVVLLLSFFCQGTCASRSSLLLLSSWSKDQLHSHHHNHNTKNTFLSTPFLTMWFITAIFPIFLTSTAALDRSCACNSLTPGSPWTYNWELTKYTCKHNYAAGVCFTSSNSSPPLLRK